jgi:hypothetical protein
MNSNDSSKGGALDLLAEEFAARVRSGDSPSIEEYLERHPELADQIRPLFATIQQLEQAKVSLGETIDQQQPNDEEELGDAGDHFRAISLRHQTRKGRVWHSLESVRFQTQSVSRRKGHSAGTQDQQLS